MKLQNTNTLKYKVSAFIGKTIIRILEFFIKKSVINEIYLNNDNFPWVKNFENDFTKIREEYFQFLKSKNTTLDICKISEEQYKVIDENSWSFIPLYSYGSEIEEFSQYFPVTKSNLKKIPFMTTAFFSILKPQKFIKEHRGSYKGYLRYQLGIDIPQPNDKCGIMIENIVYHWDTGQSVIFDDTYIHSAWNNSSQDRTVLYVDFIRPMNHVLVWISILLTKMINKSLYIQNINKNIYSEIEKNKIVR